MKYKNKKRKIAEKKVKKVNHEEKLFKVVTDDAVKVRTLSSNLIEPYSLEKCLNNLKS